MERCEYVYPDSRLLVTDQIEEQLGDATQRYVTDALNTPQPISPEFHRNPSFVKLGFTYDDQQSKPQYQMVLGGQDDQKESDVNTAADLTSVPTEECPREEIQLDGVNIQDSDDTDSDFSALSSQPSSLNHPLFDSQSSEEINQVVTPIDGEEREVDYQWSVEEAYKGENDIQVVTVMPVECEDKSVKPVVVLATPKTVQDTVDFEPPKHKQQDVAKVLYSSNNWQAEFPFDQIVSVKRDKKYQRATVDSKGRLTTLLYKKVTPLDHQIFNKWKQLDDNVHCDSVVAYLEDENFGYIVKEYLENAMAMVLNKIISLLQTIAEDIAKFDKSKHQTAYTMSQWRGRLKEQQRLRRLLKDLVTGMTSADECLHQLGFASLNLHVSNLFVRFNCSCWAIPTCVHGSSGVAVVIRNCELAYPVGSLVDGPTTSKALELLDPMHKYKKVETIYDNLDLVIFVIKVLTKISGNKNCKRKLNGWISNIASGVFADPPIEDVQLLCEECGITHNDTIKMIDYLKVSAVHYARLHGEHEV